jgi:AraC-like DNA-binding protein
MNPVIATSSTLDITLPAPAVLARIEFLGVFALYASAENEDPGTIGARVQVRHAGQVVSAHDIVCGKHYLDAPSLLGKSLSPGDGITLTPVGVSTIDKKPTEVSLLSIDFSMPIKADSLRFVDMGSEASFCVFEAFVEAVAEAGCPFHHHSGGIALEELAGIVRAGDRLRFRMACQQFHSGIERLSGNLDEARGLALTFLSVILVGMLELGAGREMHRFLLAAGREFETFTDSINVAKRTIELAEELALPRMKDQETPAAAIMNRALQIIDRNYGKELDDSTVASSVGLSRSHFRFLFKESTGQPFQKYLVAVRLEKAKTLLTDLNMSVSEVSQAVGFVSPSHFSRAFAKRFGVPPTLIKQQSTR